MDEPLLIPIPTVQIKLGDISRTTVYQLFKLKELEQVRIGSRSFATAESVAAYVGRLKKAGSNGAAVTA
jgi:predicted DNA-binding transcriptional regulator AlpA